MHDRQTTLSISVTKLLAATCGLVSVVLIAYNFTQDNDNFGFVGLLAAAAAAVLRIRSYFCGVAEREQAAFRLGQEASKVRGLP